MTLTKSLASVAARLRHHFRAEWDPEGYRGLDAGGVAGGLGLSRGSYAWACDTFGRAAADRLDDAVRQANDPKPAS